MKRLASEVEMIFITYIAKTFLFQVRKKTRNKGEAEMIRERHVQSRISKWPTNLKNVLSSLVIRKCKLTPP